MKLSKILLVLLFIAGTSYAQKNAYIIYKYDGTEVTYEQMLRTLARQKVVLFGELHNNAIAHWLQYEVTADLHKKRDLILGAEMFEADNQKPLSDYVRGRINYKELDSLARLWSNTRTDYLPLAKFAKANKLDFIATNIPRRYARMVHRKGFDVLETLTPQEKSWMAPLPMPFDSNLPTYQSIIKMMGDHGSPKLVMAQACKDATMAHFIAKNYKEGALFIHYNGAFHSDYYEGILWYLQKEMSGNRFATISTVEQEDIYTLEEKHLDKADYIICVDKDVTKTY